MFNFYDTSSLLLVGNQIRKEDNIVISSITLQELENIKTSMNKSPEVKYQARILTRFLEEHPDYVYVQIFNETMLDPIIEKAFTITDDMRILATAIWYDNNVHPDDVCFYTNDLALKHLANVFFGDADIKSVRDPQDYEQYDGYVEVSMSEQEMSDFYQNLQENTYDLFVNQYLLIKDLEGNIVDCTKWTGTEYVEVPYRSFKSKYFGEIKPKDYYQRMALDSLNSNQLTILEGKPGSGKSLMAMAYMFNQLEKGYLDRLYLFCNPVAVRGAAKLGYYPGDKNLKLLDSSVGNFLNAKIGDRTYVEQLIEREQIILIPMADCRGIDVGTDSHACIYITEAQNMSVDLMKLALQRAGNNCKVILDGDTNAQLDLTEYAGLNNGLRRVSEVFKGEKIFGKINLKTIYRSKIAEIAERM